MPAWAVDPKLVFTALALVFSGLHLLGQWILHDHDIKQVIGQNRENIEKINEKRSADMTEITRRIGNVELDVREIQAVLRTFGERLAELARRHR